MTNGLLKDIRIIVFLIAIFASLIAIAIYPPPPEGKNTNLKFGLDLEGGSWLQLKLIGSIVQIDVDRDKIIAYQFSELLNDSIDITNSELNSISFTTTSPHSKDEIKKFANSLGYTTNTVSQKGNLKNVTLYELNSDEIIRSYLEKRLSAEVKPIRWNNRPAYEIRSNITKEKLINILEPVGGRIKHDSKGNLLFEERVTKETLDSTKDILSDKLNVLGLKEIPIRTVGSKYILIDLAGVDIATAESIVSKPGKFEIRIQTEKNETAHVLYGDDIERVRIPLQDNDGVWGVGFTLNKEGANKLRDAAIKYGAVDNPELHELSMYLDNRLVYSAPLAPELADNIRKVPVTDMVARTGTGEEGRARAKELQIHLSAGALPVQVEVIGSGQVSAALGAMFREQTAIAGILALLAVSLVVYLRYHQKKILLPMLFTSLSEVVMILGFASIVGWQLDLPSIAGIIAVIGTGIDHLVIITDEVLYEGRLPPTRIYLSRISKAFAIIFAAATTTIIAMSPLLIMGFGVLKGFAIIAIVGVLIGVFIARPAYGRVIKEVLSEK
ncbi:MAG: preprotein translocase subunit SecD [Methanosarcinales archaeon]